MSEPQSTAPRKPWPKQAIILLILLAFLASLPALWQLQSVRLALAQSLLLYGPRSTKETALALIRREGPAAASAFLALYKELVTNPWSPTATQLDPAQLSEELVSVFSAAPRDFNAFLPQIEALPPGWPRAMIAQDCLRGLDRAREATGSSPIDQATCARLALAIYERPKKEDSQAELHSDLFFRGCESMLNLRRLGLKFSDLDSIIVQQLEKQPQLNHRELLGDLEYLARESQAEDDLDEVFSEELYQLLIARVRTTPSDSEALSATIALATFADRWQNQIIAAAMLRGQNYLLSLSRFTKGGTRDFIRNYGESHDRPQLEINEGAREGASLDADHVGYPAARLISNLVDLDHDEIAWNAIKHCKERPLAVSQPASVMAILPTLCLFTRSNTAWRRALAWIAISEHRPIFALLADQLDTALCAEDFFERIAAIRALTRSLGSDTQRETLLRDTLLLNSPWLRSAVLEGLHLQPLALRSRLLESLILDSQLPLEEWQASDQVFFDLNAWQDPSPPSARLLDRLHTMLIESQSLATLELLAPFCARANNPRLLEQLRDASQRIAPDRRPPPGTLRALAQRGLDPQVSAWIEQWLEDRLREGSREATYSSRNVSLCRHDEAFFRLIAREPHFPKREDCLEALAKNKTSGAPLINSLLYANSERRIELTKTIESCAPLIDQPPIDAPNTELSFRLEDCIDERETLELTKLLLNEPLWVTRLRLTPNSLNSLENHAELRSLIATLLIQQAKEGRLDLWRSLFGADLRGAPRLRDSLIDALPAQGFTPTLNAVLKALLGPSPPPMALAELLQSKETTDLSETEEDDALTLRDFSLATKLLDLWTPESSINPPIETLTSLASKTIALSKGANALACCLLIRISPQSWNLVAQALLQMESSEDSHLFHSLALRKYLLHNMPTDSSLDQELLEKLLRNEREPQSWLILNHLDSWAPSIQNAVNELKQSDDLKLRITARSLAPGKISTLDFRDSRAISALLDDNKLHPIPEHTRLLAAQFYLNSGDRNERAIGLKLTKGLQLSQDLHDLTLRARVLQWTAHN